MLKDRYEGEKNTNSKSQQEKDSSSTGNLEES